MKPKNENSINFFEEKLWITLYYLSRHRKIKSNIIDRFIVGTWSRWWHNDNVNTDVIIWLKEHMSLSIEEIKNNLDKCRDKRPAPEWVNKLAQRNGYLVRGIVPLPCF